MLFLMIELPLYYSVILERERENQGARALFVALVQQAERSMRLRQVRRRRISELTSRRHRERCVPGVGVGLGG